MKMSMVRRNVSDTIIKDSQTPYNPYSITEVYMYNLILHILG